MTLNELIAAVQPGYDLTFEMNEFNEPRIKSDIETIKDALLFILFSKPNQYPSLPTLGLDLQNILYSYFDELNEDDLVEKICEQCSEMRDYFKNGIIQIKKVKYRNIPSLLIHIEGTENFPEGYMKDDIDDADKYLIGITFDQLNQMIYNVNVQKSTS